MKQKHRLHNNLLWLQASQFHTLGSLQMSVKWEHSTSCLIYHSQSMKPVDACWQIKWTKQFANQNCETSATNLLLIVPISRAVFAGWQSARRHWERMFNSLKAGAAYEGLPINYCHAITGGGSEVSGQSARLFTSSCGIKWGSSKWNWLRTHRQLYLYSEDAAPFWLLHQPNQPLVKESSTLKNASATLPLCKHFAQIALK